MSPARDQSTGAGAPSLLRRLNLERVLRLVRTDGPMVRSELAGGSGLSRPTINEIVDTLLEAGLVEEELEDGTSRPRRRGPRARVVRFNARRSMVVGLDVGATKTLAILTDLDGELLGEARLSTPRGAAAAEVFDGIRAVLTKAVDSAGMRIDQVAAITVGSPGVFDPATGVVRYVWQLRGWDGLRLASTLEETLGVPVNAESEAHLAIVGEHWKGVAADTRNSVYIQIGVGVGMGILIDGNVYRGSAGAAGEIGYLPVGADTTSSHRLGAGAFEESVGASAFLRLAERAIADGRGEQILAARQDGQLDPAAVLRAAETGDPTAVTIVGQIVDDLAHGIASVTAVLNPELVVVGGGLAAAFGPHLAELERAVAKHVPIPPRIERSVLGDRAVALGAVRRAIEHVERGIVDDLGSLVG